MIRRAQWKRMQGTVRLGLPPGERGLCKLCQGLIVVEIRQDSGHVVLHHAEPWCEEFRKMAREASFLELGEVPKDELAELVAALRQADGSAPS